MLEKFGHGLLYQLSTGPCFTREVKQGDYVGKIKTALTVAAVGIMAALAIGTLFVLPSPVKANIGFARNTGISCSECHSNPSDPGKGPLTSLGTAYRGCLYNPAPNQPDCNIQAQHQQRDGGLATPQQAAPTTFLFGTPKPNNVPSVSQSNPTSRLAAPQQVAPITSLFGTPQRNNNSLVVQPDPNSRSVNGSGGSANPGPPQPLQIAPAFSQPAPEPKAGGSETKPPVQVVDQVDRRPIQTELPLPVLPLAPVLSQRDYPDCKEAHQHLPDPLDKAKEINSCTSLLDDYYTNVLTEYRKRMNGHQDEISKIYTEKVAGRMEYLASNRQKFYAEMRQEHAASDAEGENMAVYRSAVQLYQLDRDYLSDRYCYNTGCGGYAVPSNYGFLNIPGKEGKPANVAGNKSKSKGGGSCKKSRGRGQLLGGIFGGIIGAAAGLDETEILLAAAAGAVLVGEIACKLSEDEQKKASEATYAVAEQETVGAVANWTSPTRSGVSGSSTVTALNTQPNGRKCLSIIDVAIIDGEETRVSKQMCRGAGQSSYAIMA